MKKTVLLLFVTISAGWCSVVCESPVLVRPAAPSSASTENAASTSSAEGSSPSNTEPEKKTAAGEPAYITVQHCLIGFKGSVGDKPISRTKEDARKLAVELLDQLKMGADFEKIIEKNTDDSPPGIYKMSNNGFPSNMADGVFGRSKMVPAFGDTGFPLTVGEYGLAEFDETKSPYGWHIVKRIK
jgi:hypothetical protein